MAQLRATLLSFACVCLLLVNNVDHVESRRHKLHDHMTMFVFGDSFADTGNLPKTEPSWELSRQWYYPYGSSYNTTDRYSDYMIATGRFSDYMVQSDIIANMLGHSEAPPAHNLLRKGHTDRSGLTFAVGGAGAFEVSQQMPTLRKQVDDFEEMVDAGTIKARHLRRSVALVAVSGNDYARVRVADTSSFADITEFIRNVTSEIAANVDRLQSLGVKKVLVNNLHPIGCAPSQTRSNSYASCDDGASMGVSIHNKYLKQLLDAKEDVFVVNLHTAFTNIINRASAGDGGAELSEQFEHKLAPCCVSNDPESGYCGQVKQKDDEQQDGGDQAVEFLYTLCTDPAKYFYWDDMHPTQAGWDAVMQQLQDPIKQFLGLMN